jgi:hypothetical protein
MAYGDPYATVQDLEARLNTLDDGHFLQLLDAASRAIEDFCGRQFNKDTAGPPVATVRKFVAVDPQRLPVDDFHTTTALVISVNGTTWPNTDVDPRPFNGIYNGMTGWPYFDLISHTKSWPSSRYPKVTVTAHWGWAAVPEAIKQATLDVAEGITSGSGGTVRQETLGTYSVAYAVPTSGTETPPELQKAAPYRRKSFGVA